MTRKPSGKCTVMCAGKEVSVHTTCVFCAKCGGIRVNKRVTPNPYAQALRSGKGGLSMDQQLIEGMEMFNTVVDDVNATDIECDDRDDLGYLPLTRRY
ncbi:MAG TPA: hypothetical protein O0W90_02405 [Methanocorpusculum sp.]|nr:hypothetical protein [Methanocorpusculum sp.]